MNKKLLLASAVFIGLPGLAFAQCANGLLSNCPPAISPQSTDIIYGWQFGQTPHSRSFSLTQIGATPSGISGSIQFNNSGAFSGSTGIVLAPGVKCDGSTDNAAIINNAIALVSASGGGTVILPPGVCAVGSTLTITTGVIIEGAGTNATTIRALSGLATSSDVIDTFNFSSLLNSNTAGGPYNFGLSDLTIDGNRAARGTPSGGTGGLDIGIYGFHYTLNNVLFLNAPGSCVHTQWATSGTVPVGSTSLGMDAHWYNVSAAQCGWKGIWFEGPHDSVLTDTTGYLNISSSFYVDDKSYSSAINTRLFGLHVYGNDAAGVVIDSHIQGDDVQSESNNGQESGGGSGGDGIDIISTSGNGALIGSHIYVWNNTGVGISIGNTAGAVGTNIADLQSYSNTGNGVNVNVGYNGPSTVISGASIGQNGGDGIDTCIAGAGGGAFLTVVNADVTDNNGTGVLNCMQNADFEGMMIWNNKGNGFDTSGGSNNALITLVANLQGNSGTDLALGTLVGDTNNIQAVDFTAAGATAVSFTSLGANNVMFQSTGSGTNQQIANFNGLGTFTNGGLTASSIFGSTLTGNSLTLSLNAFVGSLTVSNTASVGTLSALAITDSGLATFSGVITATGGIASNGGVAAAAGTVGQYVSSFSTASTTVSATTISVATVTMGPGDWDCRATAKFTTTVSLTAMAAWILPLGGSFAPNTDASFLNFQTASLQTGVYLSVTPGQFISTSVATVSLIAYTTGNTASIQGLLSCRLMR